MVRVQDRQELQNHLKAAGIGTGIHYPIPLHLQKAYRTLGYDKGDFPITEKIASTILSLPMYPQLTRSEQENIAEAVREGLGRRPKDAVSQRTPRTLSPDTRAILRRFIEL